LRKESKTLILLALLLANTSHLGAQEDLSDADLQTLLEDGESSVQEVSENAPTASEPVSSETVDLNALEASEPEPSFDPNNVEAVQSEPKDAIEMLPVDTSEPTMVESPSSTTTSDDLESIRADLGPESAPAETPTATETVKAEPTTPTVAPQAKEPEIFDVGREERELLALAQNITGQISDTEWNEVATAAKAESYTVVQNDWLFKISKRLFGTGFYYPKIWSLNSYITNPHFIEPGMVLSFTTGSGSRAPEVKVGSFSEDELNAIPGSGATTNPVDLANFGEETKPAWVDEKKGLENQGVYFQYASEETMDDLAKVSEQALNKEYEHYTPPANAFEIIVPKNYDKKTGFDKNSKIFYSVKEGFYLSTFVSTNIVQDFGSITDGPDENIFFTKSDRAYVQFDETMNVLPGDKFSVYSSGGKVKNANSDREGYKYSIVGQVKTIKKIRNKWEVEFIEVAGTPQRGDRITAYTPKIERITRTYNSRLVEAAILATFQPMQTILGFGDVVYLDRGRADGVEMGNVFEVYGFKDRLSNKNITDQPTYKLGELTIITLTDNFATALITNSIRDFYAGDIAMTKTKEAHLREQKAKLAKNGDAELTGGKALEELDVELNLENMNDELLNQADKIQLTEDELAELERQEREKSVIKDSEKDLKALERLENEIEHAESILNDAKLDEDKLLEQQNLNDIEKKQQNIDQDSLDEIEENLGKRYIDEDLNSRENPFGLTEFDVEEVDELLNVEKKENQ
jgi:hypothetical protein